METTAAHYQEILRPIFAGRKVLLIGNPVVGLAPLAAQLVGLGAERPFLLGSGFGTGPEASAIEFPWHALDVRAASMIEGMHAAEALLADLPGEARDAIAAWDPDCAAIALGAILLGTFPEVAGRRVYARREPAWAALEDKLVADELWEAAAVAHPPSRVVPARRGALAEAVAALDSGDGVALVGDTRTFVHGGASFVRWVRDEATLDEAAAFFGERCDRVRATPFLEGVPCSIHGVVLPDGVAVFRPVELLTLRRPGEGRLAYAGFATFWDPGREDREAMRSAGRRVGEALRERVGYRGAFTVDGVMAREGFLPTEVNPRIGAGLGLQARSVPELPLIFLSLAAAEGEDLDYRAADLERLVVEGADARRGGSVSQSLSEVRTDTRIVPICERGGALAEAAEGEETLGVVSLGPAFGGSFLHFAPRGSRFPCGPSFAPAAVRALAWAETELGAAVGPLEAPRAVRERGMAP